MNGSLTCSVGFAGLWAWDWPTPTVVSEIRIARVACGNITRAKTHTGATGGGDAEFNDVSTTWGGCRC